MSNFTDRVKKTLNTAREEAKANGNDYVGTEHILLGLLLQSDSVAAETVKALGIDIDAFVRTVQNAISNSSDTLSANGTIPFSPRAKKILEYAAVEARELDHKYTGTEHMLLALFKDESSKAFELLSMVELEYNQCKKAILQILSGPDGLKVVSESNAEKKKSATPFLDNFSRDLTELAREGKIDPIVGREDEIERVVQILARRKKNNPILLGEAGVGKTAIVEGLAIRVVENNVPDILYDKRICGLDLTAMVAGTKYRGQFEERIKALMAEIKKNPNVITFIDEIHTMVGAGDSENGMDAANIFKPALARGEFQVIGATTFDEYRKSIEKDSALERRFQSVTINEPSVDDSILILNGIKNAYENHHKVKFTPEALSAAVKLSDRYITSRQLPDKAIDVIDEAGARLRIKLRSEPSEIKELESEISDLEFAKEDAILNAKFVYAAEIQDKIEEKKLKSEELLSEWNKSKDEDGIITEDLVIETMSKITGIPLSKADDDEIESLLTLEDSLRKTVIGQDNALEAISNAIRRSRIGIHNPKKPMGTFMFLGPTGVGKTELAKTLAKVVFKSEDNLIRIDMSEYMDKINVSRLIGAAPGFVGYEEGGQLTEAVRKKPYSVILFDEIEKAHRDVFNILLQILDEGHITDSLGRKVNFKNTIIIMTSNVGSRNLTKGSLGFILDKNDVSSNFERTVDTELKKMFTPEFLNRIDETIIFHPLSSETLEKIVEIQITELTARLLSKDINIVISDDAKKLIASKSYDPAMGARPMKRVIQKLVEDKIAMKFLKREYVSGSTVNITVENSELSFN